ncbi:MAG: hypothetical protein EXX96DRAFT_555370 [Benjaminiella poitrasii]|nr:MAG: hypothetical protein EXX96DRAFT_555370 [Benjaminiella poitrasii]
MAQNILRNYSTKTFCKTYFIKSSFSTRASGGWFRSFLTPAEEKKLYLGITSAFREKLVEQSNKSAQSYSNIIEHAIISAKPIPPKITKMSGGLSVAARMEQLRLDLDEAGQQKDIKQLKELQFEMDKNEFMTVAMYNRLIRAYIWSDTLELAQAVLRNKLRERGLLPTTRTFIYLIQAHLKKDQLREAKDLVEQMKQLSLLTTLRTSFDCNVMMSYYQVCGNTDAIEDLWSDIMKHADTIKPGPSLFVHYVDYLLSTRQQDRVIVQTARTFLSRQQDDVHLNLHQYMTWIKAIHILTNTKDTSDTQVAENLLFYLIKNTSSSKSVWEKASEAIEDITNAYLKEDQELKIITFYYKLRKSTSVNVPNEVFRPQTMRTIEKILGRIEQDKEMITELQSDMTLIKA